MGVILANAVKVLNKEGFSVKIGAVADPTPLITCTTCQITYFNSSGHSVYNKIVSIAQSLINAHSLCADTIAHRTTGKAVLTYNGNY